MGHKAVETTCNINTFGPRTANQHSVQWWFKRDESKGDESLEDEECKGKPSKGDNNQLKGSSKLILL